MASRGLTRFTVPLRLKPEFELVLDAVQKLRLSIDGVLPAWRTLAQSMIILDSWSRQAFC